MIQQMNHEEEINRLHRRQGRTKFVVLLIVGFMALLTYLLISVSKQLAEGESMDFRSRASESGLSSSGSTQSQGQQDGQSCYTITGRSSGVFGRQFCDPSTFTCKNGLIDGKTSEGLRSKIEEALRNRFNHTGTCTIAAEGSISCTASSRACPSIRSVGEAVMKDFCKCTNASAGSQSPQAPPSQENPPCVSTVSEWYRRGSCSVFERCTPPNHDPLIVTCKDATGRICKQGRPDDQSCSGATGGECNNRYKARANTFCGL